MKKLARFTILSILFIALFLFFLCVIPAIVWIFGGPFLAVINSAYSLIFGLLIFSGLIALFSECFDHNFYTKK